VSLRLVHCVSTQRLTGFCLVRYQLWPSRQNRVRTRGGIGFVSGFHVEPSERPSGPGMHAVAHAHWVRVR
jgi:hypothetical protein